MTTIADFISKEIKPVDKIRHEPMVLPMSEPIEPKSGQLSDRYEAEVFNYLLKNKESLGIEQVIKHKNLLLDGAVVLTDKRRLGLEIKFRMNWEKACQAEYQFRNYLRRHNKKHPMSGGLVFFEEFSGGWLRRTATRGIENGWNFWYVEHSEIHSEIVEGFRVCLLQLCGETLEGYRV